MTARELRCTAGHVVGQVVGPRHAGLVTIQHQGREFIVFGVVSIRCVCGAVWRQDAQPLPLADLEHKAPSLAGRT